MNKKLVSAKLAEFDTACRSLGLKLTHQRREIYAELASSTDHPSVETLYKRLLDRMPTVSLDTVYRTLATLESHGLVKRVQTLENQTRYEVTFNTHHHFICDSCKQVFDFTWDDFDLSNLPGNAKEIGNIREKNVVLHGTCKNCLNTTN